MRNIKYLFLSLPILSLTFLSFIAKGVEFDFNVRIDKQTCKLSILGTSDGEVDFGNIQSSNIKNNKIDPIPIKLKLSDCLTNDFAGSYIIMVPKSNINNITFNDNTNRDFGVSISEKSNAIQSTSDADFFKSDSKVWSNINNNHLEKKLYTYIKCKNNTSCNPDVGSFSSTITFSFIID